MKIAIEPDYLTFPEIARRWRLAPGSFDLHRVVMKNILKPCVLVATDLQPLSINEGGALVPDERGDRNATGWRYPIHQCQVQTAAFEARYPVVSDMAEDGPGRRFWELAIPITLSDVLTHGVAMYGDLLDAEQAIKPQGGNTKEENKRLTLISVMLADAYRWDPRQPNGLARELSQSARKLGLAISDGTCLKHMRQAFDEFPPAYMLSCGGADDAPQTPQPTNAPMVAIANAQQPANARAMERKAA